MFFLRPTMFYCCLVILGLFHLTQTISGQCDLGRIRVEGDIVLSTIMGLRAPAKESCGEFLPGEIQVASAVVWAVQKLNGPAVGPSYIPGLKLGVDIEDDCGLERKAAKIALDKLANMSTPDRLTCNGDGPGADNITYVGFIGTSSSQTTATVADLLRGTNVPLIGAEATAPALSNRTIYPNFVRVVPSDVKQTRVLLETLKELKWSYVALVYSDDKYGIEGAELFKKLALMEDKVCVRYELKFSPLQRSTDILTSLTTKLTKTRHNHLGVVFIGQLTQAQLLLRTQYEGAEQFRDFNNLFWVMSEAVGTSHLDIPRQTKETGGVITVALPSFSILEFKGYFLDRLQEVLNGQTQNPLSQLYKAYIETLYMCKINGASEKCTLTRAYLEEEHVRQADFVNNALDATYVLAAAVKEAHSKCPGKCSPGYFTDLANIVKGITLRYDDNDMAQFVPEEFRISRRRIQFDNSGDVMADSNSVSYSLYNYWEHTYSLIGEYKNNSLTFDKNLVKFRDPKNGVPVSGPDLPTSSCRSSCPQCILREDIQFSYVPGDKLIVGIFSLSSREDGTFDCGSFRSNTIAYPTYEAFNYAIGLVKKEVDPSFGGLAFDDCYNPLRAEYIWAKVLSGDFILKDRVTGTIINPDNIVLVIGALSSDVTIQVADILTKLNIPQISYGATTPDLDDRDKYPYFLRTVPSDITQVQAIVAVLKKMEWSYVSMIYIDNNYGRKGEHLFREQANAAGICIAGDSIPLSESEDRPSKFKEIVSALRHNLADVVVFFGIDTVAMRLLDGFKALSVYDGEFVFVATEAWGVNERLLQDGRGQYAKGAIVLHSETMVIHSAEEYVKFITKKNPYSCTQCNWFKLFWQDHFQCDLEGTYVGRGAQVPDCDEEVQTRIESTNASKFGRDQRVIHTMNAVSAGAKGIKATITQLCRGQACGKPFRQIEKWAETAKDNIEKTTMTSVDAGSIHMFRDDGNGNIGFVVYNIQQQSRSFNFEYTRVGRYENGNLDLDPKKLVFYDELGKPRDYANVESECELDNHCEQCEIQIHPTSAPITVPTSTLPSVEDSGTRPYMIPFVVAITLAVIAIAVVCIILCYFLKRRTVEDPIYDEISPSRRAKAQALPLQATSNFGMSSDGLTNAVMVDDNYSEANPHWSSGQSFVNLRSGNEVHLNPQNLNLSGPPSGSCSNTSVVSGSGSTVSASVQQCHCKDGEPFVTYSHELGRNVVICRRCNHFVPAPRETST